MARSIKSNIFERSAALTAGETLPSNDDGYIDDKFELVNRTTNERVSYVYEERAITVPIMNASTVGHVGVTLENGNRIIKSTVNGYGVKGYGNAASTGRSGSSIAFRVNKVGAIPTLIGWCREDRYDRNLGYANTDPGAVIFFKEAGVCMAGDVRSALSTDDNIFPGLPTDYELQAGDIVTMQVIPCVDSTYDYNALWMTVNGIQPEGYDTEGVRKWQDSTYGWSMTPYHPAVPYVRPQAGGEVEIIPWEESGVLKRTGFADWACEPTVGWWEELEVIVESTPTSYIDRTSLIESVGSIKGIIVTVDSEPGNVYTRNDLNSKWIVKSGNTYDDSDSIPPVGSDFAALTGTKINVTDVGEYSLSSSGVDWILSDDGTIFGHGPIDINDPRGIATNNYVDLDTGNVYKKYKDVSYYAKSVSIRTTGAISAVDAGIRRIEFYYQGVRIEDQTGGAWTVTAPEPQNFLFYAERAFDTSRSKTGGGSDGWCSLVTGNQCLNVTFETKIRFDKIVYNNYHDTGNQTERGFKDVTIRYSPTEEIPIDYDAVVEDAIDIWSGTLIQHASSNVVENRDMFDHYSPKPEGWQFESNMVSDNSNVSSYVDKTELLAAVGASKGVVVTIDSEPGNTYIRNNDNTKWIPGAGNKYLIEDMPSDTDFEMPVGLAIINKTEDPPEWLYEDGV